MRQAAAAVALAFLLAACAGTSITPATIDGAWDGTITPAGDQGTPIDVTMTLRLTEHNDVHGDLLIPPVQAEIAGSIEGNRAQIRVLTNNTDSVWIRGTFNGDTFTGSHYVNDELVAHVALEHR